MPLQKIKTGGVLLQRNTPPNSRVCKKQTTGLLYSVRFCLARNNLKRKDKMEVPIITKDSSNEKPDTVDRNMYCFSNCKQTSEWTASVKRFVASNVYTSLDMIQTGKKIHYIFIKNGCTVKDIQCFLNLACPQSIYRWIKGQTLPSIDNLYRMAEIFQIHMEDMLVAKNIDRDTNLQQIAENRTNYPLY